MGVVIAFIFGLLLALAVHVALIPFLLMVVLGAFGVEVSFLLCVAIWLLVRAVASLLK